MLSTPTPPSPGIQDIPDTKSTAEQVRSLIDLHNSKQGTRRFHSVDEVAMNLGLPPRPRSQVNAWIDTVVAAVDASPTRAARKPQTFP